MSKLLLEKMVELESNSEIDNLKTGDVVDVGKRSVVVFDRREGDVLFFYSPHILENGVVVEFYVNRSYIHVAGNRIQFTERYYDQDRYLTSADGDDYKTKRDYLADLGQMRRI